MPKVDRRIIKTREAIHKALIGLMSEKSFDDITINDISEKANLNRGTLYLHYADKYDLLDNCIKDHLDSMLQYCVLSNSDEAKLDVVRSPLPLFRYLEEHFPFYSSVLTNKGITCFQERLNRMVKYGIAERLGIGGSTQGDQGEVAVQFLASAFVGVVEWWIKNKMPLPPQIMATQLEGLLRSNVALVAESRNPTGVIRATD